METEHESARQQGERIADLEADLLASEAHVAELQAEALLRDERITELVREVETLNEMTEHRSVIEQAKGVIMSTMQCSPDAAFAVLVAQSQAQNRKLRDIAAELADLQHRQPGAS